MDLETALNKLADANTRVAETEEALSAALDERDVMFHELGQIVRDLSGYDEPHVVAAVERALRALDAIGDMED